MSAQDTNVRGTASPLDGSMGHSRTVGLPLLGRDAELELLQKFIGRIDHEGTSVIVRGEPGVGKSTLLQAAVEFARGEGCLVLEAFGMESESLQPFAGLHQLLRPLLDDSLAVPDVQQRALLTALGLQDGPPPQLFLIALAALTLIVDEAASHPVVLVVDDVQWLDDATNQVLAFISRRVTDDPVMMITGLRDGHAVAVSGATPHEIVLSGLDESSAGLLLDRAGPGLSASERTTILNQARGNPLALLELPDVWQAAGAEALIAMPIVMPLTTRLERAFAARIEELSPATRDALLVAAVDGEDSLTEIMAPTSLLSRGVVTPDVLEAAKAARLITFDELTVRFRHPLMRSGVLYNEPLHRRQAAHAAMGEALRSEPSRGAWHEAQAVEGPDDDVADRLEASHVESIARGSIATAVAALERSAQLTTASRTRGRRLLLAARFAFALGRADLVSRLVDAAEENDLSELDVARAEWLREIFSEGELGDTARVLALCELAARSAESGDHDLALDLLASAALRSWWSVVGRSSRSRLVAVAESLTGSQDDARCIAAIAVTEPVEKGQQTQARLAAIPPGSVAEADQLIQLGYAARAVGAEVSATDYFDLAEAKLREQGQLGLIPHVLAVQAAVCIDLGDWRRSAQCLAEARRLAAETEQPTWGTGVAAVEAVFTGLSGDTALALQQAADIERTFAGRRASDFLCLAQFARGAAHLSAGHHEAAFAALEPVFDPDAESYHPRESLSTVMLFAEAAAGCGAWEDGRAIVVRMEAVLAATQSPVLAAQLVYARAVLADDAAAEPLFLSGLAQDLTRWPWPRARTQLAYGNWLRRRHRLFESREPLRAALATFELIGATGWAGQARSGLRAAGERQTRTSVGSPESLMTAQEMQIAWLAAEGLSNRDIGQRLYLSPRTIGSHLYRIFPKLGVRSRAELAARLRKE